MMNREAVVVIKEAKKVECDFCKKGITIREYVGLEGIWWTDHHCEEQREYYHREIDRVLDESAKQGRTS